MTATAQLQIPAGMSSMTSREQAFALGGAISPLIMAIIYFLMIESAAIGGAIVGGVTYAVTH